MLYRLREEGGVLRDDLSENIRVKGLSLPSPLLAKDARNGAPRFGFPSYLRMPSLPMTVL
jgi:hypothetical protein